MLAHDLDRLAVLQRAEDVGVDPAVEPNRDLVRRRDALLAFPLDVLRRDPDDAVLRREDLVVLVFLGDDRHLLAKAQHRRDDAGLIVLREHADVEPLDRNLALVRIALLLEGDLLFAALDVLGDRAGGHHRQRHDRKRPLLHRFPLSSVKNFKTDRSVKTSSACLG